jgi:hypothetical protein
MIFTTFFWVICEKQLLHMYTYWSLVERVHMKFSKQCSEDYVIMIFSQQMFERLKPFCHLCMKEINTCCYIYHSQMEEMHHLVRAI